MVSLVLLVAGGFVIAIAAPLFAYFFPPSSIPRGLRAFERRGGVSPWLSLLVIGIGTVFVLGFALRFEDPGFLDALAVGAGALGPLFVVHAIARNAPRTRLASATSVSTGSPQTGPVAVCGKAAPVDESIDSPAGDVVACAWVFQRGRQTTRSTAYHTLAEAERIVPLTLDDGSGPVRIDEETVTLRTGIGGTGTAVFDLDSGDRFPDPIERFLTSQGVDIATVRGRDGVVSGTYRLKLRYIGVDDTATAIGDYERVTRESDAFWGITATDEAAFLFGGGIEVVRAQLHRGVVFLGPIGLAATVLGFAFLGTVWNLF